MQSVRPAENPDLINSLLLQELEADPLSHESLPDGWLYSKAAQNAKERIHGLILSCKNENMTFLINATCMCRIMPLWHEVMQQSGISPQNLFIVCVTLGNALNPWQEPIR